MLKRRRQDSDTQDEAQEGVSYRVSRGQRIHLEGVLDNGKKSLFRAFKVARGFERQKLGRRQKLAKEKHLEDECRRLDAEVATLKSLDLLSTAELHLYKTLSKTKSIASTAAFSSHINAKNAAPKPTLTAAYGNVTARLYNSSPVKLAMSEILDMVRGILGLEKGTIIRKKRLRAADFSSDDAQKALASSATQSQVTLIRTDIHEQLITNRDKVTVAENGTEATDSDDEFEVYGQYASRLADSLDESSGNETAASRIAGHGADRQFPAKFERQSSFSPIRLPELHKSSVKPAKSAKPAVSVKATTFLPSLTLGGYYSNSESAESDSGSAARSLKPRKNRMGQQARRQLWEKKFGVKANHVKKQDRDQGWDERKGAQGSDERGLRDRGRRGRAGGRRNENHHALGKGPSGANSDPVGKRPAKKEADGPLHPSWEAAKRMKEDKKTVAFEGKKIVFD